MGNLYTTRVNFKRKTFMGLDSFDDLVPRISREPVGRFLERIRQIGWHRGGFDMALLRSDIGLGDVSVPPETVLYTFEDDSLCLEFETPDAPPREWIEALPEVLPEFDFAGICHGSDDTWSLHFANLSNRRFAMREAGSVVTDEIARDFMSGGFSATFTLLDDLTCSPEADPHDPIPEF